MSNKLHAWNLVEGTIYNMYDATGRVIARDVDIDSGELEDANGETVGEIPAGAYFLEADTDSDDDSETSTAQVGQAFPITQLKVNNIYRTKAGNFFIPTNEGLKNFNEKKWTPGLPVKRTYKSTDARFRLVGPYKA